MPIQPRKRKRKRHQGAEARDITPTGAISRLLISHRRPPAPLLHMHQPLHSTPWAAAAAMLLPSFMPACCFTCRPAGGRCLPAAGHGQQRPQLIFWQGLSPGRLVAQLHCLHRCLDKRFLLRLQLQPAAACFCSCCRCWSGLSCSPLPANAWQLGSLPLSPSLLAPSNSRSAHRCAPASSQPGRSC